MRERRAGARTAAEEAGERIEEELMVWSAWRRWIAAVAAGIVAGAAVLGVGAEVAIEPLRVEALRRGEALWKRVAESDPLPGQSSRQLVGYALTLCESRQHAERLERLLTLTARMQDRDPASRTWGNLRWYWRDAAVTDGNAVEFCMQDALVMWIRHRDWMPADARRTLEELLRLGAEGCLRHRVATSYTNIALLNAGNLIVVGEQFQRLDAAAEGGRRLDAVCLWTAALGTHEFCSPTYYGINLSGLLLIATGAKGARQQEQAHALLELLWSDIAANWIAGAERLGGTQSRSYDYLRGAGALDWHLWRQGWLTSSRPGSAERLEPLGGEWNPSPRVLALRERFPRLVRQSWGALPSESRTHQIWRDASLSCSGASYGSQDMLLTVDLPGPRAAALLLHS